MKRLWNYGLCVLATFCLVSCYPDDAEYIDELDIALTHYDEKTDFTNYKTFTIPDSIVFIKYNGDSVRIDRNFDEQILSLVRKKLENYNYIYIASENITATNKPDVVITITACSTPYVYWDYGYSWYDMWSWYPFWGDFGWGPGYMPWYSWYGASAYSYENGTLAIEMLDTKTQTDDSKRIPVLWTGVVEGILSGSPAYIGSRLEKNIDQCFKQSPYLKTLQ